jgi:hypothetical protein
MFPGERLMFKALPEAVLEIHTGAMASSILSDKVSCYVLRVIEEVSFNLEQVIPEKQYAVCTS